MSWVDLHDESVPSHGVCIVASVTLAVRTKEELAVSLLWFAELQG